MKFLAFRDGDSGILVSMILLSDDNHTDVLHSQLKRAQAAGLLEGVRSVQVAETDDPSLDPADMEWTNLF